MPVMLRELKEIKRRPLSQSFYNFSLLKNKDEDKEKSTDVLSNITNTQPRQKYKSMIFDDDFKLKKSKRLSINFGRSESMVFNKSDLPDETFEETDKSSLNTSPFTDNMDNSISSIDEIDTSVIKHTILTSPNSSTMSAEFSPLTPITPTTPTTATSLQKAKRSKRASRTSLSNIMEFIHQINYDFVDDVASPITKEIDEINHFNKTGDYQIKVVSSAVVMHYQPNDDVFKLDDIDYTDMLANEDYHLEVEC